MNIKNISAVWYLFLLFSTGTVVAQNKFEEVLPYQDKEGYLIIQANVGGREGQFVLNTKSGILLTEAAAKSRNLVVAADGRAEAQGFFIGKNLYYKSVRVKVEKETELFSKLGVEGVIGFNVFTNCVLSINTKNKTIIISGPYRPLYVKIENRGAIQINEDNIILDLISNGKTTNVPVEIFPVPANSFLKKGLLSLDIPRGKYYLQAFSEEDSRRVVFKKEEVVIVPGKVNEVDRNYFLSNIYDYRSGKEWKTIGDKPVVVDFWASWCGPCLRMMPIMEEMAAKYKDKIIFYKVNVDKEGELRDNFNAIAIPLVFFAPVTGTVFRDVGADSKEKVEERLKAILNK
ncbi:thioredoxin domain-containing protein [Pedobacter sp. PLR]|uniref:thioredoxin family protein n=1 Tax=Pedobacter sp. PLR TaxID=2994465 RepID=UPI002246CD5B|nr:thioredoxin domain-containing protein [Pedobacter sp. PLR]MCX2452200.1 thioredoxin domain-containing protein [Pedobacter sp. PLR]